MKNNMEPFITVQKVFWQILCKLEDHFLKTKKIDRKNVKKKFFYREKKKNLPSFYHTMEQGRPEGTIYNSPQVFPTVIMKVFLDHLHNFINLGGR